LALKLWFFSNLVEESLVNFQRKISQVMITIGFTFNDFDFVINPFQFTGMDGIFAMIQDAIAIAFEHFYEAVESAIIQRAGKRTPMIQRFVGPGPGFVSPDMFQLVL
jgi:hypothetical protein